MSGTILEGFMEVGADDKSVLGKFYSRPYCALEGNGSVLAQREGEPPIPRAKPEDYRSMFEGDSLLPRRARVNHQ